MSTNESARAAGVKESILRSLRRITRAIDLHSRHLAHTFGLTGPQLVCLRTVGARGKMTPSELAKEVSLSQATITGIIDRLAARQLVARERSTNDRRLVSVVISAAGRALIDQAPSPLQERFAARLSELSMAEQENIQDTLARIVRMMDGEEIMAAPVLSTSPIALSPEEATTPAPPPVRHDELVDEAHQPVPRAKP
jgi:DNA-binding MarR family transcriptional regulator